MLQEVTIIPVPQDLQRKLQRKLQKRTDRTKDFLSELNNIEEEYKYSEEEEKDLKELYLKYKGDFSSIMECMMTSTEDDEERFREILEEAIDAEELPMFEAFDEYNYPEDKENEMYNAVRSQLDKKTQQRESEFNEMISMMEDKYAEEESDSEMI
jgi:hypothetical protein